MLATHSLLTESHRRAADWLVRLSISDWWTNTGGIVLIGWYLTNSHVLGVCQHQSASRLFFMDEQFQKLVQKLLDTDNKIKENEKKNEELNLVFKNKQEEVKHLQEEVQHTKIMIKELEVKKENINAEIKEREKSAAERETCFKKLEGAAKRIIEELEEEVILNIGGKLFYTTKSTLTSQENMFYGLFSSGNFKPNKRGEYFIDRNPEYFHIILDYLRGNDINYTMKENLMAFVIEFDYYSIQIREIDSEMEIHIRAMSAKISELHEKKLKEYEKKLKEYEKKLKEYEEKKLKELKEYEENKLKLEEYHKKFATVELFSDCSLLAREEQTQIMIWTEIIQPRKLLYKGTRDGFGASDFHRLCDRKGKTIVIVKSTNGYIFGGYSAIEWQSKGAHVFNQKCFLFSVKNANGSKMIKLANDGPNQYSIFDYAPYGPTFGGGHDMHISNNCNSVTTSYSNLGHSYSPPLGYTYGSSQAKSFLAGTHQFQVVEIEVFGE